MAVGENMQADLSKGEGYAVLIPGAASGGVSAAQTGMQNAAKVGEEINSQLNDASRLAGQAATVVNGTDRDVDALRALAPQITGLTNSMGESADAIAALSRLISGQGENVAQYAPMVAGLGSQLLGRTGTTDALAGKVQELAEGLTPYAESLSALADHLFGHGHDMVGRANTTLDQGQGLIAMDAASSPLAAEWLKLYKAVSPDTLAAMARADAQSQNDSAYQQMLREVSRRGGSISSGNSLALQKQFKTALATATASAMNQARIQGRAEQTGILDKIGGLANELLKTGTTMQKTGVDEETAAGATRKTAADVQTAIGGLFANAAQLFGIGNSAVAGAGQLFSAAGGLEASAADVFGKAADAESASVAAKDAAVKGIATQAGINESAGKLGLSQAEALNDTAKVYQGNAQVKNAYLSNLNDATRNTVSAYATLSDAMAKAADYYHGVAQTASRGGGGGSISTSSEDKPDFWDKTGHSSTWWANTLPADDFAAMAALAGVSE